MLAVIVFWSFQLINGLTALAMVSMPKKFHESLFRDPQRVYERIGFSTTAVEMVHNIIRGQGASLLAVTVFLLASGPGQALSFLLIGLVCGFMLFAHLATAFHHRRSAVVMEAVGSLSTMYPIMVINFVYALAGLVLFFIWPA